MRCAIRLAALCLALGLFLAPAAAGAGEATDTIDDAVNAVMAIIKTPGMKDPAQRPALLGKIEKQVQSIFDFEEFSARTVGPYWRAFTPDQKTRFIDAFASLLRALYLDKLEGYNGEQVQYLKEIQSTKGDKAEVQTTVQIKDKAVPVFYRMTKKDSAWKVYDVIIEGMSMVENYRGQFKDIIAKNDAEALIAKVTAKADEIRRQNAAGKG